MTNETMKKILISATTALLLTACMGDESSTTPAGNGAGQQQGGGTDNNGTQQGGGTDNNGTQQGGGTDNNGTQQGGGTDNNGTQQGGGTASTSGITDTLVWNNTVTVFADGCANPKHVPSSRELLYSLAEHDGNLTGVTIDSGDYPIRTSDSLALLEDGRVVNNLDNAVNTICVNSGTLEKNSTVVKGTDGNFTTGDGTVWIDTLIYGDKGTPVAYDVAEQGCKDAGGALPTGKELNYIFNRADKKNDVNFTNPTTAYNWTDETCGDAGGHYVIHLSDGTIDCTTENTFARCVKK